MAVQDDFGIDYTNKRVYHVSGTTVYDVNAIYSWLMDTFDELVQMDDPVPMSAQTPTEYTMINEWFFDDESPKYLKNGAIKTSGYLNKIQVVTHQSAGYTNCAASDVGKMVTDDGANTGNLLAYNDTIRKWWVRWATQIASASVCRIDDAISAAKSYNGNTAVYADETADINNATANDVILPPIQITTAGDAIYIGEVAKFGRWRLNVGTAGVWAGGTAVWEYWNGAWVTLAVTDGTTGFTVAGTNNITWTIPGDWATTAIDGVTKYWIRRRFSVVPTSITTAPLGTQGWEGTGQGTASANSASGEDLFANVYTLGTIESVPAPQIYIFQAGSRIAEWSTLTNWDRGQIDVLIKVKESGTEIAAGVITVFARQSGDLYDNYEIDLTAGGRNAVPLSTADDLNEDTGEYYLLYDAETVGFTTIGQIVTGGTSGAKAELVAVTDWGTTGRLTLRDVRGTFQDNETITGSSEGSATINGTVGDTYGTYSAVSVQLTIGLVCTGGTSTAKRILRGIQSDGATGKYVFQVSTIATGTARTPYYRAFSVGETITDTGTGSVTSGVVSTTIVSGFTDITLAFVNGTVAVGTITGTYTAGERVTYTGGEAILLKAVAGTLTLGNVTNTALNTKVITGDLSGATCTASADLTSAYTMTKAFEQQSAYPYAVIVNAGGIYAAGRTLAQVYEYFKFVCQAGSGFDMYTVVSAVITILDGEEYIIAYSGYTLSKVAPFGTFAGGKYFGAQGAWIEGIATGQSYQYTDSNGVIRQPYASIDVSITNLVSGDKVTVFRTSAGAIDKAMYTSHATNNVLGDSTFDVQETLATDTPSTGIIRVVDASENKEHRIRYASWSGLVFTLPTARTGTQTGATSTTVLIDSAATFSTWGILAGDIIRNTTDGCWAQVASVDSETQLTTTIPVGGTNNNWANTNAYSIHTLPVTYTGSDKVYVPFIDKISTATLITQTVLYSADRAVLVRARRKQATAILPFETSATVTTAGLAVAVIRTEDTIVT